jgi:hypothetical protein
VLEPQGTFFLFLLILAFGGLVTWLALARHVAIRVLAAFLAFPPAAVFGIAVVNKYYDYYHASPHRRAAHGRQGRRSSGRGLAGRQADAAEVDDPQLAAADRRVEMLAAHPKGIVRHKGTVSRKRTVSGTVALPTGQPTRA